LADQTVSGEALAPLTALVALAGVLGLQELLNLLTADCDGLVAASQGFAFTARQLAEMVANPNQTWSVTQQNPGTNSPTGCGANSSYHVNYLIEAPAPRRTFQSLDGTNIFVLGSDGNLWLEHAPFGQHVPPSRQQVDGNVLAFQELDTETVLVLGTDGNLWLEQAPFGNVPPNRQQIDGNVRAFQAQFLTGWVWVLGTNGNLWLEQAPFGTVPPQRQQIDGNVQAFQPLDLEHVLVLGTDGNLWLEQAPFGQVPPSRQQVDGNVA
jgi:hypothetical protein